MGRSAAAVVALLAVVGVAVVFEDKVPRIPAVRQMLDRFRPAEQGAVSCARDAPETADDGRLHIEPRREQ